MARKYILQTRKSDTLATTMAAGATSCTLTTGAFGSPTGNQIITIDGNIAAKAADFDCAIAGTAVTSMTLLNGPDVEHAATAQVSMNFVDEHYSDLTNNGLLGYAEKTTPDQTGMSSTTDITGATVTVTVPDGARRVEVEGFVMLKGSTANVYGLLEIREGTTVLGSPVYFQDISGNGAGIYVKAIIPAATATAGSHTYKLSWAHQSGGTMSALNTTSASWISAKYLGGI